MKQEVPRAANRILVADDDPTVRCLLEALVEKEGWTMVAARNGREAYEILRDDDDFAGVVMDLIMPHIEGLELIRYMAMERRLKEIPVMMITSEPSPRLPSSGFKAGAVSFVPKPLEPASLGNMLRTLVTQRGAQPPRLAQG